MRSASPRPIRAVPVLAVWSPAAMIAREKMGRKNPLASGRGRLGLGGQPERARGGGPGGAAGGQLKAVSTSSAARWPDWTAPSM